MIAAALTVDVMARSGYLFGIGAYLCWGLFPIYWKLLRPSGAMELLAHRIVWSCLVVALIVTVTGVAAVGADANAGRLGAISLVSMIIAVNGP